MDFSHGSGPRRRVQPSLSILARYRLQRPWVAGRASARINKCSRRRMFSGSRSDRDSSSTDHIHPSQSQNLRSLGTAVEILGWSLSELQGTEVALDQSIRFIPI